MEKLIRKNAVLYKEMMRDMKRPKALIIMMIINAIIGFVVAGFFCYVAIAGAMYNKISPNTFIYMFITIIVIETILINFITPALTAGSVSLEKERQTLDVLLTTRMTPWEIIKGKYLSNVVFLTLLVISTMPAMAFVFIYGGINIFQMFGVVLCLITTIMYISSFGIFFSALTKNTVASVILTYICFYLFMSATLWVPGLVSVLAAVIESAIENYLYNNFYVTNWQSHIIPYEYAYATLYLNPFVTLFDCIGNVLGLKIENDSINGMRGLVESLSNSLGSGSRMFIGPKNILLVLWTPISMVLQLGVSFILLRLSAALLNPIKGRKNKKKKK